jgi:hypothetical protein
MCGRGGGASAWYLLQGEPPLSVQGRVQALQRGCVHFAVVPIAQGTQLISEVAWVGAATEGLSQENKFVAPLQHLHASTIT